MKRRIIILLIVLAVVAVGGFVVYNRFQASAELRQSTQNESLFTVTQTTLRETLTVSGKTDATEKVTLSFPIAGKLAWVGVKEGDVVKKYQGIASLDQRDIQKKLESSLNTYMISRWDFEQTKQDNKNAQYTDGDLGDKMKRIVDRAQFGLNNAVITVELQALAKEYSYLYTPIAGVVTKVGAPYAGVNVGVTTTYEVINPQTTYFSATADQTEVPKLKVGQQARILLDAYPDEQINASIDAIAYTPKIGETGTTYEVKLAFAQSADIQQYRNGMTGDAEFIIKEKKNVLTVPINAVRSEGGKKFVTVVTERGEKVKTELTLGEEGDNEVEVISGLKAGDKVLQNSK